MLLNCATWGIVLVWFSFKNCQAVTWETTEGAMQAMVGVAWGGRLKHHVVGVVTSRGLLKWLHVHQHDPIWGGVAAMEVKAPPRPARTSEPQPQWTKKKKSPPGYQHEDLGDES